MSSRGASGPRNISIFTHAPEFGVRVDLPKSPRGFTPMVSFFLCSKKVLRASS